MKRITAFILCMLLAVSSVSFTFAESADNSYEVERSLGILNAIGRFTEYDMTTIEQTKKITRGEFAEELAGLLKLESTTDKLYYYDVSMEYYAYGAITALTEAGFTSGCGNGLFEPERAITRNEAATVLVSALGYKKEAVVKGGDEFAFARIATRLGLYDGTTEDTELTFGDMLVMFTNSLIAPVLEAKVFGRTVMYRENDNESLLSLYYDSRYVKNQRVTFANNTGIYGDKKNSGYVTIGDKNYVSAYRNMEEYLGSYVNFIYKDIPDAKVNEIYWIEKSGMSEEITLTEDEIGGFNSSDYTYSYYTETGKAKTISLNRNISVIYNGKFEANSVKYLEMPCDEIRFVSDKNGRFDVAVILSGESYVIDTIYATDHFFTVKNSNKKIGIDAEEHDEVIVLDAQGNVKSTDDLASDITVSVFESTDRKYIKLIISDKTAEGTVTSIRRPAGKNVEITLDNTVYEVGKTVDTAGIAPGNTLFVYLDYNGKISYINKNYTSVFLAYITGFASEGIFSAESKLKAYTQNGKFEIYDTTDKFKIDEVSYSNPDAEDIGEISEKIINKLAILEFDKNGRVRSIDVEGDADNEGVLEVSAPFTTFDYRPGIAKFGRLSVIDSATKIFGIPNNPQTAEENEFRVMNKSQLGHGPFYAQTYKYSDATEYAEAAIIQGFEWNSPTVTAVAFVYEGTYQVIDSEGDEKTVIYGFEGADEKEYYCDSSFNASTLTVGCGVLLRRNGKGEVQSFEPVFDRTSAGNEGNSDLDVNRRIVVGYLNKRNGNVIIIGYNNAENVDEKFDCTGTPIIVVDESKEDVVSIGNISDITLPEDSETGYLKVVVQTMQLSQLMVVVYK